MSVIASSGNSMKRYIGPSQETRARQCGVKISALQNRLSSRSAFNSFPPGAHERSMLLPVKSGGIVCRMLGVNDIAGTADGVGDVSVTMIGINDLQIAPSGMTALLDMICDIVGSNTISASAQAFGDMLCNMKVNELTEADVKGAVIDSEIEPGMSMKEALRILLAVAAGKTNIVAGVPGSATVTFRDINDLSDRVTATMTGSERSSVIVDPD